jgi:hypothetical protein
MDSAYLLLSSLPALNALVLRLLRRLADETTE